MMACWLLVPLAYLIGSVSFAWLAGRLKGIDLREHGSRNLGATNVGRVLGSRWGFAVFFADLAKGLLPVLLARALTDHVGTQDPLADLPIITGAAAILGHSFTCLHRFRGGKAVATSLGVLVALVYIVAAIALCTWMLVWAISYGLFRATASAAVGPASVAAALIMPFAHLMTYKAPWNMINLPLTIFLFAVSALVIVKHRSNIARIFKGQPSGTGDANGSAGTA
jgi:glycerol-3-phosphate acyltransferase PlsY